MTGVQTCALPILGKHGYFIILKDNVVIKKNKVFICSGNIVDGLYILTLYKHELYNSEFDHGGEYLLGDFKDYLIQNGIVSQLTAPRTP